MSVKTTDYTQFKVLSGNRAIDKGHVINLAKSLAQRPDLLAARPILVNKDMEVIDGQHRLAAAQQLKIPVYYDVADLHLEDTIVINHNQRNWSLGDYAKSYADLGKKDYQTFMELREEYPWFNDSGLVKYLLGGGIKGAGRQFRSGEFKIVDLEESRKWLDQLEELYEIEPRCRQSTVSEAWLQVFKHPNYDHNRMLNKMRLFSDNSFRPYGPGATILRSIEDTYNFKQSGEPVRLYGR
jgi:hypothetical protein